MLFIKKPVVIEAIRLEDLSEYEIKKALIFMDEEIKDDDVTRVKLTDYVCCCQKRHHGLPIKTLEGIMIASVGDYIIKGIEGEFYPCKPEIFKKTYDPLINEGEK